MKRLVALMVMFGVLLQAGIASALLELNVLEESYGPGDYVDLGMLLKNDYGENKTLEIEEVIYHERFAPSPAITEEFMEAGEAAALSNIGFTVQNTSYSGEYVYSVTLYENSTTLESANASFRIEGTLEEFEELEVKTCIDYLCELPSAALKLFNTAYIKAFETEGSELTGTLTFPDYSSAQLIFTNDATSIIPTQTGTYSARITASKEGYQDQTIELEFYVVEKDVVAGNLFAAGALPEIPLWVWLIIAGAAILIVLAVIVKKHGRDSSLEDLAGKYGLQ